MKKELLSNKKGFTLIELIIVVTIIAILGAIIFFGIASTVKRSRAGTDTQNAAIIMSSVMRSIAEGKLTSASGDGVYVSTDSELTVGTSPSVAMIGGQYLSSLPKVSLLSGTLASRWAVKLTCNTTAQTIDAEVGVCGSAAGGKDPADLANYVKLMPKPAAYSASYDILNN